MIDAHQHLWTIARPDCRWPTAVEGPIHRDFDAADFRALSAPAGVVGSILVQSQEGLDDMEWLLEIAEREPIFAAAVGWADLGAPEAAAEVRAHALRPKLRAIRPMVQDKPADWYDDARIEPALAAMTDGGLRLEALVRVPHLAALERLALRHSSLPIAIDHAAKPRIGDSDGFSRWRAAIAPLAERPNVWCKFSGLLTEAPPGLRSTEAIAPYADALIDLFGPDRLMWGSDWPVLNLAGDYAGWLAMALELIPEPARCAVFETSARAFYGLGEGGKR